MSVTIRAASEEDLQDIIEIFNQAIRTRSSTGYLSEVTLAERKGWFAEHTFKKYPILVAEQNHRVIGWAGIDAYRKGRKAFEKTGEVSLFVHQEYRRKGIGNQLLITMLQTAKELGYTNLFAIVLDKNVGSRRLLEKNNFEQWGFLPDVALIDGKILSHVYYGKKIC
jgi:L-amino acid N-acyltransferase YncA